MRDRQMRSGDEMEPSRPGVRCGMEGRACRQTIAIAALVIVACSPSSKPEIASASGSSRACQQAEAQLNAGQVLATDGYLGLALREVEQANLRCPSSASRLALVRALVDLGLDARDIARARWSVGELDKTTMAELCAEPSGRSELPKFFF